MLQAEYKRGIHENHLILKGIKERNDYQTRILIQNEIKGIIPIELRYLDGTIHYYYEISSKQSLRTMFSDRAISYEEVKRILLQIYFLLQQSKEYLLEEKNFLFGPDFLYLHVETFEMEVVFFPENKKEIQENFLELAEFFLQNIDHKEEKGVFLAYQFYKLVLENNFIMEDILKLTKNKKGEQEKKQQREDKREDKREEIREEEIRGEADWEVKTLEQKKHFLVKKENILFIVGILFLGIGISTSIYIPFYYEKGLVSVGLGIMLLSYLFVQIIIKKRKTYKEASEQENNNSANENSDLEEEEDIGSTVLLGMEKVLEERKLIGKIEGKEEIHYLKKLPLTVGKAEKESDIIMNEKSVSRVHARIFEKEGKLYLEDLNSTNGTYKNGIRLDRKETVLLEVGDEVQFAKLKWIYQ